MSIVDRLRRSKVQPDYEQIRRELLLTLADGRGMNAAELMSTVITNAGGEIPPRPKPVFSVLDRLTEEGLVETKGGPGNFEHNKLWRITDFGKDELEQMGAANV